jgi:hypothetical protein
MEISAGALFAMLVISSVGFSFFLYGKKQARIPQLVTGMLLMVCPYFVGDALWMSVVAAVLLAGLWFACRSGL